MKIKVEEWKLKKSEVEGNLGNMRIKELSHYDTRYVVQGLIRLAMVSFGSQSGFCWWLYGQSEYATKLCV